MTVLADLAAAAAALARGEIVLMPTDTLTGLHARADDLAALDRLGRLKGRAVAKPFVVIAASLAQVESLAGPVSPQAAAFLARCWPGPYSVILPASARALAALTGGGKTVAIRIPDLPWLRELAERVGVPLASTSANRAGEPPVSDPVLAAAAFAGQVQVFAGVGPAAGAAGASALVDLTGWPPRLLRAGPYPLPEMTSEP